MIQMLTKELLEQPREEGTISDRHHGGRGGPPLKKGELRGRQPSHSKKNKR